MFNVSLAGDHLYWKSLAVASDVFDDVLFCAVLCPTRSVG